MTPALKEKFYTFLFTETPLYHQEDIESIIKWVDENIINIPVINEVDTSEKR